jgi:hypothetical protein
MKITISFFAFIIISLSSSAQLKNCEWKATTSNTFLLKNKDSSFSFVSSQDTGWLYLPNKKSNKLKKSKVLSVTNGTDLRKYKIYKKGEFLYLKVKSDNKVQFDDTLANINGWQEIRSYSLGSDNYKLKDRLNYLDTTFVNNNTVPKKLKEDYYILYTTYLNVSKFTRWYIRRSDLTLMKMETCYKASPFCPLIITVSK